jgi:hypothetical protein
MSKHTPGPWDVVEWGSRWGVEATIEGYSVVVFGTDDDDAGVNGRDDDEMRANTRLIAAAPELLAALRDLQNIASGVPAIERNPRFAEARRAALAAIAKAEGSA